MHDWRIKPLDDGSGKLNIDINPPKRDADILDVKAYSERLNILPFELKNGVPWFNQNDPEYQKVKYSKTNLGEAGCGVFSFASVWNYYYGGDGVYLLPEDIADYAIEHGISTTQSRNAFKDLAKAYNMPEPKIMGKTVNDSIKDYYIEVNEALDKGDLVIVNVQNEHGRPNDNSDVEKGYWTSDGHYIVVTGKTDDGKYYVVDSMDKYKSDVPISGDKLFGEGDGLPYGYIAIDFPNPNNQK